MKRINKALSVILLVLTLVATAFYNTKALAAYTYTVSISLAGSGNEGAAFEGTASQLLSSGILSVERDASVEAAFGKDFKVSISEDGSLLKITGLQYSDRVSFDPKKAVAVSGQEKTLEDDSTENYIKYYVKGIRKSGSNASSTTSSFEVTGDSDYVIAYGVGSVVPYVVNYLDEEGNKLLDSATYYGQAGEELYVSYRYISGYIPDSYNLYTKSLKAPVENEDGTTSPQEFTFTYTKGENSIDGGTTVIDEGEGQTIYDTVTGETTTEYQEVTVPAENSDEAAGQTNTRNTRNAGANGGNGAAGQAEDEANQQISDEETPAGPAEITEIPNDDVPQAGGISGNLIPIIAGIIIFIAVLTIIFALVLKLKRNKKAAPKTEVKDTKDNE